MVIIEPRYTLRVLSHELGAVCGFMVGDAPARDKGVHLIPAAPPSLDLIALIFEIGDAFTELSDRGERGIGKGSHCGLPRSVDRL